MKVNYNTKKLNLIISLLLSTYLSAQESSQTTDVLENKLDFINRSTNRPAPWSFKDYTKEGNVEISTGAFGISIPFYEIKEENLNIPIGISYRTSGVKVNQNASEIGVNWELMAGGVITRTVRGHSDERNDQSNFSDAGGSLRYIYNGGETITTGINLENKHIYTTSAAHNGYIYTDDAAKLILNKNREQFPTSRFTLPPAKPNSVAQVMYETSLYGKDDYEQDIFTVNLGKMLFHFSFKLGTEKVYDYATRLTRVEGVCLDEKGYKIFAYIDQNRNILSHESLTNIIQSIAIKDTQGITYEFKNYEKTENEYIFDYYRYPFLGYRSGDASPAFVFGDRPNAQSLRNQVVQHLMKEFSVNKWNLSKIILANGKEVAFTYSTTMYVENNPQQRIHDGEYLGFENNTKPKYNGGHKDLVKNYTYKNYLTSINSENVKIEFDYDSNRPDYYLGGLSLNKVSIKTNSNQTVKIFKLIKQFSNSEQFDTSDDRRMFLSELQEWSKDNTFSNKYSFSYNNPDNLPSKNFLPYSDLYGYYLGNRDSPGASTNLAFPMVYLYPYENHGERISYEPYLESTPIQTNGLDRRPNGSQVSLGVLNKVIFPAKGTLNITYEPNTYYFAKGQNSNPYGPGVRVKRLEYRDGQQNKLIKEYSYNSSGKLLFKPSFAYIGNFADDNAIDQDIALGKNESEFFGLYRGPNGFATTGTKLKSQGLTDAAVIKKMLILSNKDIGPQFDLFGREMIYTNVTESTINTGDQSKNFSKKFFNFYEDNSPEVNVVSCPTEESTFIPPATPDVGYDKLICRRNNGSVLLNMSYGFAEKRGKNIFPFPDRDYFGSNNELKNGKTYLIESFDAANNKVLTEEFDYELYNDPYRNIEELKSFNIQLGTLPTHFYDTTDPQKRFIEELSPAAYFNRFQSAMYYYVTQTNYYERALRLKTKKRTQFFPSGNSIQEIVRFDYTPYQFNLSLQKEESSDGTKLETSFKYANDLFSPTNNKFIDAGLTGIPLVIEKSMNSRPIFKSELIYSSDWVGHERFLPWKMTNKALNTLGGLEEESFDNTTINQYDEKGNVLDYSMSDVGKHISIIWGYNKTLPIAKIVGVSFDVIRNMQEVTNAVNISNSSNSTDSQLLTALDNLRKSNDLKDYQITTYTHIPLVGVKTTTPPNGVREDYYYDDNGRLEKVVNINGKILKEYKYNFKQ